MRRSFASWIDVQPARQVAEGNVGTALATEEFASLNYLLASTSGSRTTTASPPGSRFLDHVINKKADIVRVYLPPMPTVCCR